MSDSKKKTLPTQITLKETNVLGVFYEPSLVMTILKNAQVSYHDF